jgi:hypothetical protein
MTTGTGTPDQPKRWSKAEKSDGRKHHDDFLAGSRFCCRSTDQASPQQRRVAHGQIGGDGGCRAEEHRKKQPSLPVMHRAGGDKERCTHDEREEEICEPGFCI